LDENLKQLGLRSYGVGYTTLEEVFLKIEEKIVDSEERNTIEAGKDKA